MSRQSWSILGLMSIAVLAAGCEGASSARETERASVSRTSSAVVGAEIAETPATPSTAIPSTEGVGSTPIAGGIVETTFDDIKFPMEKTDDFAESMLTDRVRELFGKRIRIRGYMFPTSRRKGLTQFVLVRDNMECCFGPGAALFDCILVSMVDGATAEFTIRPIAVEGEFRLEILPGPDGRPMAIYKMAGEAVE
jgi:hypothetical protein